MDFERTLSERHSYREFKDQTIPVATLRKIVNQAQQAPSWANSQPWQVVVATGATLAKIRTAFQQQSAQGSAGNPDLEVMHRTEWADGPQRNMAGWNQEITQHMAEKKADISAYSINQRRLYNSPALVYLIVPTPLNSWEIFDTGAFAQTLMLSAANQGVQSIPAYEIVKYPDTLRQILNLDDTHRFLMGVALGYADEAAINSFRTSRVALDNMLTIKA